MFIEKTSQKSVDCINKEDIKECSTIYKKLILFNMILRVDLILFILSMSDYEQIRELATLVTLTIFIHSNIIEKSLLCSIQQHHSLHQ